MCFGRLIQRILAPSVHQPKVQAGSLDIFLVLGVAVTGDQIPAFLVQVVVMLPRCPAPFAGIGRRPSVPLGVIVTGPFRFVPKRAHQNIMLLGDDRPARFFHLAHPFV